MSIVVASLGFVTASMFYVYRLRGTTRYNNVREFMRKGWPIFAPLNCLLFMTTRRHAAKAILDPRDFPELDALQSNWRVIRDEGLRLMRQSDLDATKRPGSLGSYDVGFRTFFKYGWSRFYLNWYGYTHASARRLCPQTVEILRGIPSVRGAMFAFLPAHSHLTRHADPIALSLRYHLGLETPNSKDCFIDVDGRRLCWKDGEVLMFDETYLHYVRNDTDHSRLILMCDVKRPVTHLGRLFYFLYQIVGPASVVPNTEEDRRGLASRIFEALSPSLKKLRTLKSINNPLYRVVKLLLIASTVGLVLMIATVVVKISYSIVHAMLDVVLP